MTNWKNRYSQKKIPIPKGLDQTIRHLREHGWGTRRWISDLKLQDLRPRILDDFKNRAENIHEHLHGWNLNHEIEMGRPDDYFTLIDNNVNDHDHTHPESGKPITGIEKRYTDD